MKHTPGSLKTSDNLTLYTESWLPEDEPCAVVLISHGISEHIGRYPHVAARLVEAGYAVYGLDHRGHGKSEGVRAYFESFDAPIEDLRPYFNWIKVQHPDKPIFVYGHSLGSLIALAFTLRYQSDMAGIIISGTTLDVETTQPAPLIAASRVLNKVAPKLGIPALPTAYLSHDPAVVQAYDADPLVFHGGVRVRMGYHILQVSRMVKSRLPEIRLPLLVIHGGADKVCPPSGAEKLYNGAGSADKTLKRYADLYHEIHNEPEQATVLEDFVSWLNRHTQES